MMCVHIMYAKAEQVEREARSRCHLPLRRAATEVRAHCRQPVPAKASPGFRLSSASRNDDPQSWVVGCEPCKQAI